MSGFPQTKSKHIHPIQDNLDLYSVKNDDRKLECSGRGGKYGERHGGKNLHYTGCSSPETSTAVGGNTYTAASHRGCNSPQCPV